MRIASVVAVSGLAIGGLFYGLNSVNAAGLNKNYNYIFFLSVPLLELKYSL